MSRVGIVIASHSDLLARGVAELAGQMAPGVAIGAAGGLEDGGLGTSYDRIEEALEAVLTAVDGPGSGAVVLTDLGSATMTAESVVEMSEAPERIRLVDTALVEGAVAAAVRAEVGDSLDDVARAAASVRFGAQDQGAPDHAGEAGAGGCGCAGSSGSGGPGGSTGG
ncbi:dihydroxyacetone kinase, phosphotransfer subunit, partial [Actinomyces sp. oral taxon 877 str. F0543]